MKIFEREQLRFGRNVMTEIYLMTTEHSFWM